MLGKELDTMRTLNERFTEEEFERLERGKGDRTWREALLDELAAGEDGG